MPNTYEYLDLGQFRSAYVDLNNAKAMKFFVDGVRCSKCISKIEKLSSENPDLQHLEVDLGNQTAWVELKSEAASFARVAQDITNLGFRVIPLQPSEDANAAWKAESRRDLVRLAVAAFCSGNIMMLAFATYFGLTGELKSSFEWIQFALYLPVVTFVAWPFYKGSLQGLRQKSLSIDGPMAIASFLGFCVSSWNLFQNSGGIYFDSLSGFLFLILATRYAQKRTRFEYLKYLQPSSWAETFRTRLITADGWIWKRSDQLKKDDEILVLQGEWAPADGELLDSEAVIDLSVLNGESMPRRIQKGFNVKAGTRFLVEKAQLRVERSGATTMLGSLLSSLKRDPAQATQSSRFADKASQILLVTVLFLAALTMFAGVIGSFEVRFERALALIILACPCAMAFGTPLAFSFSMKRAQEKGIIVKSSQVFEKIKEIKTIFIDKTGTITERFWNLSNSSLPEAPSQYQEIILKLEAKSQHPIAFALREIWAHQSIEGGAQLQEWQEIPSQGVRGKLDGQVWEFRHLEKADGKCFALYKDGTLVWEFRLTPILQSGAREAIAQLLAQGYTVKLLSGDSLQETLNVAHQLGIDEKHAYAKMTPQMKAETVRQMPNAMMIGDGVNDALALQEAQVGVAVRGGVELALKSADVLLLKEGLESLQELLKISAKARAQIRRNLTAALIYNSLGGLAALLGWVNPFVAALLMPASSMFILGSTWWGTRS